MSELERLDYFDDNLNPIGCAPRGEIHTKGLWHQTFHCWVIRSEGERGYVVFQKRSPGKALYPNMLDITAAGHLTSGENPADGIREVTEELGIAVDFSHLIPLGVKHDVAQVGNVVNREFAHVFLLLHSALLSDYNLQPEEVSGLVQIEISDGLRLFGRETSQITVTGFQIDDNGAKRQIDVSVGLHDFIPRIDSYYLKVFIMADRLLKGEKYLAI